LFFRPIPDREYVEGYIKAYYFPENQLEGWLPEHRVSVYREPGRLLKKDQES